MPGAATSPPYLLHDVLSRRVLKEVHGIEEHGAILPVNPLEQSNTLRSLGDDTWVGVRLRRNPIVTTFSSERLEGRRHRASAWAGAYLRCIGTAIRGEPALAARGGPAVLVICGLPGGVHRNTAPRGETLQNRATRRVSGDPVGQGQRGTDQRSLESRPEGLPDQQERVRAILSSPGAAPGDFADGIIPSSEVAVFLAGSFLVVAFFTWIVQEHNKKFSEELAGRHAGRS